MSNNWDNEPSLDYYELRRRHEEYKNSLRQVKEKPDAGDDAPAAGEAEPVAEVRPEAEDAPVETEPLDLSPDVPADDADGDFPPEDADDDMGDADDEAVNDNPNPFDSFIKAFHGLRDRIGKRKARRDDGIEDEEEDFVDDADEGDADDHPEAPSADYGSVDDVDDAADDAPETGEALDLEDLPEGEPVRAGRPLAGAEESDYDEDAYGDEDEEEEEPSSGEISGFKKFLRLFVVPVEPDERADVPEDGDWPEEDAGDEDAWSDGREAPDAALEQWDAADEQPEPARQGLTAEAEDIEGGLDMSDQNKVNAEVASQLAVDLETPGLSRRERRELAARQAAEKAAAEAAQAPSEGKPLEADAVEDVASGIVNIASAQTDLDAAMDEPTRKYKAVSKMNLDTFLEEEKPEAAEKDQADEDGEEEEEEKPARRGLFGRRRKAVEEEEEDEDDEDDEDEEEDDRPRRGLFGRRARYDEDEDDEDEEDDRPSRRDRYDEDDYDDEEDDYDDEDEEEYEDDEYEDDADDGASFGHVLLGILKGFLTAVMLLLFVVVVLNVLNIFNVVNLDNLAAKLPTRMADVFLPSQNMKQKINVEAEPIAAPAVQQEAPVQQAQPEPEPAAEPEPEPEIEEPAEEAPVEEEAGTVAVG